MKNYIHKIMKYQSHLLSMEELRRILKDLSPFNSSCADLFSSNYQLPCFSYTPGLINFDLVTEIDMELAELLSPLRRHLSLKNVRHVDLDVLKHLFHFEISKKSICSSMYYFDCIEIGLDTINVKQAAVLSKVNGSLSLPNLKKIGLNEAGKLSSIAWNLLLGVESMDEETAAELQRLPKKSVGRNLFLPNLKQCDTECIKILASGRKNHDSVPVKDARLILGFEEISPEQVVFLLSRSSHGYESACLPWLQKGSVELFDLIGASWRDDSYPTLNPVRFDGLKKLSREEASSLAPRVRSDVFSLSGLKKLEPGVAEQLAKFGTSRMGSGNYWLNLSGLETIEPDESAFFASMKSHIVLDLSGIKTLNKNIAEILSQFTGCLLLNGISTLDDITAESLSNFQGKSLQLKGLESVSRYVAECLVKTNTILDFPIMGSIADEVAEVFSQTTGSLHLNGLTTISKLTSQALVAFDGIKLELNGLTEIPASLATKLLKFRNLPRNIINLDEETAKVYAENGSVTLDCLLTMSPEVAQELALCNSLSFDGLTDLMDATAEALVKNHGSLSLNAITELSQAAAEALAKHEGWLSMNGITELSDTQAVALSKHRGDLHLNGITELTDCAAKAFASNHSGMLYLNGLKEISDQAAQHLSTHKGYLHLNGLRRLSDKAAEYFSLNSVRLELFGLVGLSPQGVKFIQDRVIKDRNKDKFYRSNTIYGPDPSLW
jgi:hypothetical protein